MPNTRPSTKGSTQGVRFAKKPNLPWSEPALVSSINLREKNWNLPKTSMEQAPSVSERQVVSTIWSHIECLLAQGCDVFIGELMQVLPDPSSFSSGDLPVLAKLHLSSAHNLMATLKLLAPAAFARGSSQPDLSALDDADSSLLGMAATLIELQLFHLQRAAALTAASRNRLKQQAEGGHMGTWSVSGASSSNASSNSQQMC